MKKTKPPHYWHEAKKFLSKKDKKLAKIINQYDGYLVSRDDPFYSLCRSIIGQQISVKAADSIWLKFEKIIKKIKPINLIKLPKAKLASIGLSRQKILYLKIIAKEFFNKTLDIKNLQKMSDDEAIKSLVRIKGIGVWTAQMFLIFNLKRSNIFPFSDIGLIKAISKRLLLPVTSNAVSKFSLSSISNKITNSGKLFLMFSIAENKISSIL